ncbi:MAG: glycosyltransferase family 2 protein [Nitrospinae bacterium]|nr:glycosyltransferase family 2 protein [Nitrospinota bacterium]
MKLSIVIPACNEEGQIEETVRNLHSTLTISQIKNEILIINDNSKDDTENILKKVCIELQHVRYLNNKGPNGFGFAVRCGLENFNGDAVAIFMADGSDLPEDVVRFFKKLEEGYDCVFGSRFMKGGKIIDYPIIKLILNRLANLFISLIFQMRYNDTTNAFKMYRRHVIQGLKPFLSHHFNLTVELPLKAIVRGYSFVVLPNKWTNRKTGESKLKIKEMGSRYLFIVLYCLLEKWLSRGDYLASKKMNP